MASVGVYTLWGRVGVVQEGSRSASPRGEFIG